MNQVERLHTQMKELQISSSEMCKLLHISTSRFANWKKRGSIPKDKLLPCANLLNVTVTWLLTGEGSKYKSDVVQTEPQNITAEEFAMLEVFKKLSDEERKAIKSVADTMVKPKTIKKTG